VTRTPVVRTQDAWCLEPDIDGRLLVLQLPLLPAVEKRKKPGQAAEEPMNSRKVPGQQAAGAKARVNLKAVTARLKSCPDTFAAAIEFSAACKSLLVKARV